MPSPAIRLQMTIVGVGIGGLAAATCLAQDGHQVQVLESGEELSEIGAGIQINPNALRILARMDLEGIFYREGTKNEGAVVRKYKDGKVLGKHSANLLALYGYQYVRFRLYVNDGEADASK